MPADDVLSETIVFELHDPLGAERLWERLRPRWCTSLYKCEDFALLAAELGPQEGNLATLLRTVQFWARECALDSIPFHLDGRAYVLEPTNAIWPAAA